MVIAPDNAGMKTPDIRRIILARLEALGRNRLWLAREVADVLNEQHLYQFLQGKKNISIDKLEHVLAVLGLTITATESPRPAPTKTPPALDLPV